MKRIYLLLITASAVLFSTGVSAQVQIDKDIQLNGTAGNRDITGAETVDVSTGYLVGGSAAAGRYLRGNGTHYVSSPLLASDLSGTISNAQLASSSLTVTAGTGMSGGGSVSLGGSVTLNNAGVTSLTGTANRVTVSASTGAVTISAPQNIHTGASPTFAGMTLSGLSANSGVYTNGSEALTTTAPATGTLGYWTRTSGALSPATLGDNVGLGTASPAEKLHLASNGSVRILLEADTDNSGEGDHPQILFSQDGDGVTGLIGYNGSTNHLRIENNYASTDADIDFLTQSTIRMTIDGNGNAGIGTAAPSARLHVRYGAANTNAATPALIVDNPSGGNQTSLQFRINNAEKGRIRSDNSNNLVFSTASNGSHFFRSGTDATELMFINGSTGLVGIGNTSPLSDLDILQTGGSASAQQTGGINLRNSSYQWRIYNSNDFVRFNYSNDNGSSYTAKAYINSSNGAWTQVSDATMKKNITPLPGVLADVLKLNPVEYHYTDNKEDTPKSMGFLAQEAQAVFPATVSHEKGETLLGIDYASFSVIAIKAIQEQQKIIEELQQTVEELKEKVK